MGMQRELIEDVVFSVKAEEVPSAFATETGSYIADLLGELQIISKISGMTVLSEDIQGLLSKHTPS